MKKFLHRATPAEKKALTLNRDEWLGGINFSQCDFPDEISVAGTKFTLQYHNTPDEPELDGITCIAKKSTAKALSLWREDYLVPGLLPEKVATILNSLPSSIRRALPGTTETLSLILPILKASDAPLTDSIRHAVYKRLGIRIPESTIEEIKIPPHLTVRFKICDDETGKELSSSRNLLDALRKAGVTNDAKRTAVPTVKHTSWDFGDVTQEQTDDRSDWEVKHFKALHDEGLS